MATGMKEYWIMHRPRHPLWGTIMFAATTVTTKANPLPGSATIQVYDGDEKDYLFYRYTSTGTPQTFAVTEKPWLIHTVCNSMEDAVIAAKRMISYVGQDNVRIAHIINGTLNIQF